jgi:hypothetical protein
MNHLDFLDNTTSNILYRNDNFLSTDEIKQYQQLLKNKQWALSDGNDLDSLNYISQDLYHHYKWDHNWDQARWLDSTPPEWEKLYSRISEHLPPHYVHWVDVKITGSLQGGTPIHRDKDPSTKGGDTKKFSRAISVLCNLNTKWDPKWGGGFVIYKNDQHNHYKQVVDQIIPIVPGQLLIINNCFHSIELITEPARSRVTFILHVLEYKHDTN